MIWELLLVVLVAGITGYLAGLYAVHNLMMGLTRGNKGENE